MLVSWRVNIYDIDTTTKQPWVNVCWYWFYYELLLSFLELPRLYGPYSAEISQFKPKAQFEIIINVL